MRRSGCVLLAVGAFVAACAQSAQTPATQIVVAITSDLHAMTELSRIEVQVSKRDGSAAVPKRTFTLVEHANKASGPGEQNLPLTFSIGKGVDDAFLLVVTGYGPADPGGADARIIEQRYIATFQAGKTLLLRVFLGRVCLKQFCDGGSAQTCYAVDAGGVKAGACGPVVALGKEDLAAVDVDKLPDLAELPRGAMRLDAGAADGAVHVSARDAGSMGAGGSGGMDGRMDAGGAAGHGDAGGGASNDPCSTNHGGCDPLASCASHGNQVTCGACPQGYTGDGRTCTDDDECKAQTFDCHAHSTCENTPGSYACPCVTGFHGDGKQECLSNILCNATGSNCDGSLASCKVVSGMRYCVCNDGYQGNGETCTDFDECQVDNGGCGDATYYKCTNHVGAAPSCEDIDECAVNNGGCSTTPKATCTNQVGAPPSCACPSGYAGTGVGSDGCARFTWDTDTVKDWSTGLIWQRVVDPDKYTWSAASTYCAGLSLAGGGWRLPTLAELQTLVDLNFHPTIDPTAFPSTPSDGFWSSTMVSGSPWGVDFIDGSSGPGPSSTAYPVRCVR